MSIRNKVSLIGRTGKDVECTTLENGKKLAKVSLATTETYYNDAKEKQEDTQWHNLIAWGKTAEIFEKYIKKGNEIAVEGKLMYRSYDDKDGVKRYVTDIVVSEILMLSSNSKNNDGGIPF